jgi:hypothetical protein
MLQTHKWRKPKWVKFPSAMLEDMRWIKLSDRAKAAWPSVLVIASEHHECRLPDPDLLFLRLRLLGHCPRLDSFSALIDEYIQCGFVLKTTPELQSYRDTEIQKEKSPPDLNDGCPIKEVVGEILQPIAQPLFRDTDSPGNECVMHAVRPAPSSGLSSLATKLNLFRPEIFRLVVMQQAGKNRGIAGAKLSTTSTTALPRMRRMRRMRDCGGRRPRFGKSPARPKAIAYEPNSRSARNRSASFLRGTAIG